MAGGSVHPYATITASAHLGQCGSRYKVNFGVTVEVIVRDEVCHAEAPFRDPHIEDLTAMSVEQTHPGISDAAALLGAIPEVRPTGADWILTTARNVKRFAACPNSTGRSSSAPRAVSALPQASGDGEALSMCCGILAWSN